MTEPAKLQDTATTIATLADEIRALRATMDRTALRRHDRQLRKAITEADIERDRYRRQPTHENAVRVAAFEFVAEACKLVLHPDASTDASKMHPDAEDQVHPRAEG